MGKRHDYAEQEPIIQSVAKLGPIKLLLPTEKNYESASVESLIFLAIESNSNIRTGTEIAKYITKITAGKCSFTQSYISRRIAKMNDRGIIARDKFWTIEKRDGKYALLTPGEAEKFERNELLKKIQLNRTTYFKNDPIRGTIFGFKLLSENSKSEHLVDMQRDIKELFKKITYNVIFDIIFKESHVYILLDTSNGLYPNAVQNLNNFLENEFLVKK